MGVDVDPARGDELPVGLDLAPPRASLAADRGDLAAVDRDVAGEAGLAGAVENGAPANHDVMHGRRSCGWTRPLSAYQHAPGSPGIQRRRAPPLSPAEGGARHPLPTGNRHPS